MEIFSTRAPSRLLHVDGSVAFGHDDKVYLAAGDSGHRSNAQDLSNPFGKILRLKFHSGQDYLALPPDRA